MLRAILDHGSSPFVENSATTPIINEDPEIVQARKISSLGAFPSIPSNNPPCSDLNTYQQKKTFTEGMFDLALLTANFNQLRYVLDGKGTIPYHYLNLTLIVSSIFIQLFVAIMLICNGLCDVKQNRQFIFANRYNNLTVIGVFLITIINAFISVFAVENGKTI